MIAQVSSLSEELASENRKRRLIALQILGHLQKTSGLPAELLNTVGGLALSDDPELAGTAQLILGGSDKPSDAVLLLELFAPVRAHLQRTKDAFGQWNGFNEALENEIMRGNKFIRDLLGEFEFLRRANILAIKNISEESAAQAGTVSGWTVNARALIYMIAGHVEHHMASLHEKYLPKIR